MFRLVHVALRILSDEAGHYLNDMCTKYADFRGLKGQSTLYRSATCQS